MVRTLPIADCQLPIGDIQSFSGLAEQQQTVEKKRFDRKRTIGNPQSAIGNSEIGNAIPRSGFSKPGNGERLSGSFSRGATGL
jgi:hypothetical protein